MGLPVIAGQQQQRQQAQAYQFSALIEQHLGPLI